ncbi:MAG: energy-coupling factor transporter transmembrane protein EcfT [Muribaculaceae bacterium]|nr:energy-coupling factor transporter transmembrane protein EcfT [Muribaculaceae bacterium]
MNGLEKAYLTLQRLEQRNSAGTPAIDAGVGIAVSVVYLAAMLSVPMGRFSMLIWFALYPIIAAAIAGIGFGRILVKSLYIVPLVALIGIFNPIYDKEAAFCIGKVTVSRGWLSFASIILRGMMAMQCILILIEEYGFTGICHALRRMGIPAFLTDQLQFVYRYMSVLLLEALSMRRAAEARGYGRRNYPVKLWGTMTGQLFLRTIDRSERINRAMQARGFEGTLPELHRGAHHRPGTGSIIYGILMCAGILALRLYDVSGVFGYFAGR